MIRVISPGGDVAAFAAHGLAREGNIPAAGRGSVGLGMKTGEVTAQSQSSGPSFNVPVLDILDGRAGRTESNDAVELLVYASIGAGNSSVEDLL